MFGVKSIQRRYLFYVFGKMIFAKQDNISLFPSTHPEVPLPATGTSLSSIPEVVNYTPLQTELPRESKFRMKKSKACINNKEQHNRTAVEMDQSTLNETTVHNQTASARRSQLGWTGREEDDNSRGRTER